MKTSIDFKIQGNHESHNGTATIIDRNYTSPVEALEELAREAFGNDNKVKINKIGSAEQLESDGYIHQYDIYESYQDSGSDDYWYFAINTGCNQNEN